MRIVLSLLAMSLFSLDCSAHAAEPDGLYLMTRYIRGSSLEMSAWYFKNGQVSNRPAGNIAQFDFKKAAALFPDLTGTYSIAGNSMVFKWANGKGDTQNYKPGDKGCFYWGMGSFCPAEQWGGNARVDGIFTGGASAGYGRVANATTLTLSSSGQYHMEQAGSVKSGVSAGSQLAGGSSRGEKGTYELSGTTMVLKPAGGSARQIFSFPYDDGTKGPAPRRIFFESTLLKRI